jgi:hypothetical protein
VDGFINSQLGQLLAKIPVIPLLLIFTFFGGILITRLVEKYHKRFIKTEEDCARIENEITPTLKNIRDDIRMLISILKTQNPDLDTLLFKMFSPLALTDLAIEILEQTGGKNYIHANLKELISALEEKNLKTALDVEMTAPKVILEKSDENAFSPIKNYIYNNPEFISDLNLGIKIKIDLQSVTKVMGIYLRDLYLEKHPELSTPQFQNQ